MERYEKYKDSGVEWIGEIPEGWEVKKLKYLLNERLKYGANESALHEDRSHPRYIRITDFDSNGKLRKGTFKSLPPDIACEYLLNNGDLLFARSGATVGKTFQFKNHEREACFAGYLIKASPKKILMDSDYLYAFTKSSYYERWKESTFNQATIQNIGADKYAALDVPLPSSYEQTAIANYLDCKTAEIDQLITQKEDLLCLYEEEKTAIINQAVTQGINPDVGVPLVGTQSQNHGDYKKGNLPLRDSGIDWLGEIPEHWEVKKSRYLFEIRKRIAGKLGFDILSITQKGMKVKDIKSNDGQMASDYSKYQIVEKDDFAMNHMDLLTGFIDIANQEGVTSPDYRVFSSIDNESNSKFYLFLFQMMYTRKIFYAFGRGAALFGRWRLPANEFKSFLFPCPSKSEQTAIVHHIETESTRINAKISKTKKIIALQKEYRTALISEVVTGKIKVTQVVVL